METERASTPSPPAECVTAVPGVLFWLDEPKEWNGQRRHVRLSGWCFAWEGEPLVAIRAQVRGATFLGDFAGERPDVVAQLAHLKPPLCCGFSIEVQVPAGRTRLQMQIVRRDGIWQQVFTQEINGAFFRRATDGKRQHAQSGGEMQFGGWRLDPTVEFWIEEPVSWSEPVRHLRVSGWCVALAGAPVSEVRARMRGRIAPGIYGITRPDVAAKVGTGQPALRSGFYVDVIAPLGKSELVLEARRGQGRWEPFYKREVEGPPFWRRPGRIEAIGNYEEWIYFYDRLSRADRRRIHRHARSLPRRPRFSILLPVYNTEARWLQRAIESVRGQLYDHWELCAVDDASSAVHIWPLLQEAARRDSRIKPHRRRRNGHISAASNDALALASGEFIALLDHDDELAPTALYFAALALNRDPHLQLLYTDEDKLDAQGRRTDPYFKSDWNPDLLRAQNFLAHLCIYSTELVRKIGGFRLGFEGAQDHDLALRVAEQIDARRIHHIPHVLYHWRQTVQSTATLPATKPYAQPAALRSVQEHLDRGPTRARVLPGFGDFLRVQYEPPPGDRLVSIIIPTRDRSALLRQTVESICSKTAGADFEIVVIDNDSHEPATLAYLEELARRKRFQILSCPGEFNFSRLNNFGVAHVRGAFVAFLNNDLEVITPDWLAEMLSHAARPEVGAVGARLWFPDGQLQHGGVLLGIGSVADHAHRLLDRTAAGYFSRAQLTQNFSAVTAACLLMRKSLFQEVGGFDETSLAVTFNDVDLCLRLRQRNLLVVWTPYAELVHYETASRGYEDTEAKQQRFLREIEVMRERWGPLLQNDPYYNPNLSLQRDAQFKLAFPPRTKKPWRNR